MNLHPAQLKIMIRSATSVAQRGALIRCLGELRFRVGIPYSMIREFRMSTEEIGIAGELLQATLRGDR